MDIEGDAFGKIYEYFLGKFAMTEGQKGGEFFTPTSIVKLIVEIIEPFHGRIFDPACGSGGMFVQSAAFVENHKRNPSDGNLHLRAGEGRRDHPALQDEPRRPRSLWRHPAGQHLLRRHPQERRQVRLRDGESAVQRGQGGQGAAEGRSPLPVRLPKTDNANYLWIQIFYHALNDKGRAGFVMANSPGMPEAPSWRFGRSCSKTGPWT